MKSLFSARSFGIVLIVVAFGVLGWAMLKDTKPYQQAANFRQSLYLWPSLRPATYLQSIGGVQQLQFSKDGSRLFVRSGKGHITIYETGSWKKLRHWKTDDGPIFASADGQRLFIAGSDRNTSMYHFSHWDVDSGKRLFMWSMPVSRDLPGFQTFSTISPDFSQVVLSHHQRNPQGKGELTHRIDTLWIAEAHTGKVLHRVPLSLSKAMPSTIRWEEQTLFIASVKGVPQRFRTSDWKVVSALPTISFSRLSADGNLLAGARNFEGSIFPREATDSPRPPSELVLYNRQTKATQHFGTDFYYIRAVFPADNALIVYGLQKDKFATKNISKDVVQIRTPDGQAVKAEIISGRMHIDAQWKVLAIDRFEEYLDIYRAADGKRLCWLDKTANPLNRNWETMNLLGWTTAEFSPDGKWYVTGEESGLIRIWELPQG